MAIDPMLYQKLSGRKGDPYTRLGEALAKGVKAQSERDALPKGLSGGLKVSLLPGYFANIFFWLKSKNRTK